MLVGKQGVHVSSDTVSSGFTFFAIFLRDHCALSTFVHLRYQALGTTPELTVSIRVRPGVRMVLLSGPTLGFVAARQEGNSAYAALFVAGHFVLSTLRHPVPMPWPLTLVAILWRCIYKWARSPWVVATEVALKA